MGVPYRDRGISVIALIVDGDTDAIGAMTGKLGAVPSVKVKTSVNCLGGRKMPGSIEKT